MYWRVVPSYASEILTTISCNRVQATAPAGLWMSPKKTFLSDIFSPEVHTGHYGIASNSKMEDKTFPECIGPLKSKILKLLYLQLLSEKLLNTFGKVRIFYSQSSNLQSKGNKNTNFD